MNLIELKEYALIFREIPIYIDIECALEKDSNSLVFCSLIMQRYEMAEEHKHGNK